MGIKNFYHGFKKKMGNAIEKNYDMEHELLVVELNGLFYSSCKKIFKFYELSHVVEIRNRSNKIHLKLFEEITIRLQKIIKKYLPKKSILLVVDGIAGMMKNMEQRQRRYKNALENKYSLFDLNNFSPGTKLLNHLTKYIDWYLRLKMSTDPEFSNKKIYFSNEKVPGEGEFKICQFLKKYCKEETKILIYNCDSDLVLLSMTMNYNITIVRNSSIYGEEFVNIEKCRKNFLSRMQWDSSLTKLLYVDLVILFFFMGNDYSPSIPSIYKFDILFDEILPMYKNFGKYLSKMDSKTQTIKLDYENFFLFSQLFSEKEITWLKMKNLEQNSYFPDPVFSNVFEDNLITTDKLKKIYYDKYFPNQTKDKIVSYYCYNLENILNMFFYHKMNWCIFFPFYHSPFLQDLNVKPKFDIKLFNDIYPMDCCFNLLTILPPQSKNLLPVPLQNTYSDLKNFFPTFIEIDLTGKKKIWEGVVKLPFINIEDFTSYFKEKRTEFSPRETKRNAIGKSFVYSFDPIQRTDFISYYGNIEDCPIICNLIDL
jgi:5'-3' exonuclease